MKGINNKKPPYYRWLSIFIKWGFCPEMWFSGSAFDKLRHWLQLTKIFKMMEWLSCLWASLCESKPQELVKDKSVL